MNICAIVPAGGRSERFGGRSKLAQDLGGRPLLIRTVELLARLEEVRAIIVAAPDADEGDDPDTTFDGFRDRFGPTLAFHGAAVVRGGRAARWESVREALAHVPDDATHVLVHDAARPATPPDLFARVIAAGEHFDAVIPALPITATVRRVGEKAQTVGDEEDGIADLILGDEGRVRIACRAAEAPIDRTGLCEIQTPQLFRADVLRQAYATADPQGATDDAMLVERAGGEIWTVEGDPRNLKVTRPADLELVRAVLGLQAPPERPAHLRF